MNFYRFGNIAQTIWLLLPVEFMVLALLPMMPLTSEASTGDVLDLDSPPPTEH
jgi:hypothetical protein